MCVRGRNQLGEHPDKVAAAGEQQKSSNNQDAGKSSNLGKRFRAHVALKRAGAGCPGTVRCNGLGDPRGSLLIARAPCFIEFGARRVNQNRGRTRAGHAGTGTAWAPLAGCVPEGDTASCDTRTAGKGLALRCAMQPRCN